MIGETFSWLWAGSFAELGAIKVVVWSLDTCVEPKVEPDTTGSDTAGIGSGVAATESGFDIIESETMGLDSAVDDTTGSADGVTGSGVVGSAVPESLGCSRSRI